MVKQKIVTKTRNSRLLNKKSFNFTRETIPGFYGNNNGSEFVKEYRERAWQSFIDLPMPETTDEPWRRTSLKEFDPSIFRLPKIGEFNGLSPVPEEILYPLIGESHGGQIVLLPGGVQIEINQEKIDPSVIFTDLITAENEHADILAKTLGQTVRADEGKFAALASSLGSNGVLVYVPRGVKVAEPLHSVMWGSGNNLAHLSHIILWLEEESALTYVHEAASPLADIGKKMHAGIVEIHVGAGANLRFVELQSFGKDVYNFTHERARVARDGNIDWIFVAGGSHLTKSFYDLELVGEGASGRMSGFYFTDGNQHLDHDTQQNHLAANTTSDLLFKGALLEQSRSVWQGMIYVAPGAQNADGYQANRNLILSRDARADSIPGLEILADDVRCTHGATVGKIDPEEIFYLQSRGIPTKDAQRILVEGFFDPVVQRIPFDGVRKRLVKSVSQKMN